MKLVLGSTILATLALASTARADNKPGWCATPGLHEQTATTWSPTDDDGEQLEELLTNMCRDSNDSEMAENGAKWTAGRAALMKKLEWSDADWNEAAVWGAVRGSNRTAPSFYAPDKKAWSALAPSEQFDSILAAFEQDDANYLADALGSKLTETGKLAYIERCLTGKDDELPVRWAMCAGDIATFDPKKVQAEVRADTVADGFGKTIIRLHLAQVRDALPKHAQDVKALMAKDDAYAKMFAAADAARKDWDAKAGGRAALLDLVLQMDDARITKSRKALAGCEDTTWKAWIAAVSAIPAKRFEHMHTDVENGKRFGEDAMGAIASQPDGYLAGVALYRCHADDDKKDYTIRMIGETLQRWPGFRGPHTSALVAIMDAALVLDDKDARIDYPGVRDRGFQPNGGSSGGTGGALATVKTSGAKTHLTFVTKMRKEEQCTKYKETGRIARIRGDGGIEYEWICLSTKMVEVNDTPSPYDVDAHYAAAMKPGAVVEVTEDVVDAVWPKSGASMPSAVFGAPVK